MMNEDWQAPVRPNPMFGNVVRLIFRHWPDTRRTHDTIDVLPWALLLAAAARGDPRTGHPVSRLIVHGAGVGARWRYRQRRSQRSHTILLWPCPTGIAVSFAAASARLGLSPNPPRGPRL